MAGRRNWKPPNPRQPLGSEYGGINNTVAGGIQPKGTEALDNGDLLRMGYVTGNEGSTDPRRNIDDLRQFYGLRPATGKRPVWLDDVSPEDDPRLTSEARRQGFGE